MLCNGTFPVFLQIPKSNKSEIENPNSELTIKHLILLFQKFQVGCISENAEH